MTTPADAAAMLDSIGPARAAPAASRRSPAFVRATEVWTIDAGAGRLTLSSGAYGGLEAFAAVAAETSFARGEGLPGKAWAEGRPVVLKGFRGSYFRRTEAAEAAGLTAAVAAPIFDGAALKGVLVFFCADGDELVGAIEVWRADEASGAVMTLDDGYFGAARHFEWVSRHTQFPKGSGLPGAVWASGEAMLFTDLGGSHRFIRAESAGRAGLTTGLGLPIPSPAPGAHVLTLLSARGAPIARRFELWAREADGAYALAGGMSDNGPLGATGARLAAGQGLLGRVVETGAPIAVDATPAAGPGAASVVAAPIYRDGALAQIAAWYL